MLQEEGKPAKEIDLTAPLDADERQMIIRQALVPLLVACSDRRCLMDWLRSCFAVQKQRCYLCCAFELMLTSKNTMC